MRGLLPQRIITDENEKVWWSVCLQVDPFVLARLKMLAEQVTQTTHTHKKFGHATTLPNSFGVRSTIGKSAMSGVVRLAVSLNIRVDSSGQQPHRFVEGVSIQKAQEWVCNRYATLSDLMAGVESRLKYEDVCNDDLRAELALLLEGSIGTASEIDAASNERTLAAEVVKRVAFLNL